MKFKRTPAWDTPMGIHAVCGALAVGISADRFRARGYCPVRNKDLTACAVQGSCVQAQGEACGSLMVCALRVIKGKRRSGEG